MLLFENVISNLLVGCILLVISETPSVLFLCCQIMKISSTNLSPQEGLICKVGR